MEQVFAYLINAKRLRVLRMWNFYEYKQMTVWRESLTPLTRIRVGRRLCYRIYIHIFVVQFIALRNHFVSELQG